MPSTKRVDEGDARDGSVRIEGRAAALRIDVLGPLVATVDGESVNLGGPKQRAVLARLIIARSEVVSADALISALWGDEPPASSAAALQAYVSHLRRRLEPEAAARRRRGVIRSEPTGYVLSVPDEAVDVWRFEQLVASAGTDLHADERVRVLTEALDLWRGPAIVEYADQPWAEAAAHRLDELRDVARERLLESRLELGDAALVVPDIERLLADAPLREERWRLLVLALYRAHRQADALAALRQARTLLADELGVDPGPALRQLETEVLAQAETLDVPVQRGGRLTVPDAPATSEAPPRSVGASATGLPAGHASPPPPPRSPAPGEELVDRDREIAVLHRAIQGAVAGQAGVVVIEGAAGIGKTGLLSATRADAAAAGATVLAARGSLLEREYGFGVVRQLFDAMLADEQMRASLLSGAAAGSAGVFDARRSSAAPAEGLFAVLHGLYWLTLNAAASGPIVIAVDDLQWCDTGSLRFLAYLAGRIEGSCVLVAATLRTGEAHADDELIAELLGDPATTLIDPEPLTLSGVGDLVRERLGGDADDLFIRACERTTLGNPLLLRQLLRALEADAIAPTSAHADTVRAIGSRAVSSMVLRRFGRMPAESREVARAVAVLGDGASLPMVAAMSALPEDTAAARINELARSEVLRPEGPAGFVHPLVRDAVYGDLSVGERELRHERAAKLLAAAAAPAEQVAAQLLLAPRRGDGTVVSTLRDAAKATMRRGGAEGAAAFLARALEEPPDAVTRPEVLLELGTIETMADGPAAVRHLTEALATLPDDRLRAGAAIDLSRTLVFAGARGEASRTARKVVEALPARFSDECQHLIAVERMCGYMHDLDPSEYDQTTWPDVEGHEVGARALAADLAWEVLIEGRDRARAIELARFAVADGSLQNADMGLLWVVAGCVQGLSGVDTTEFWSTALADAYARGGLFAALGVHLWQGYFQWTRGDLREAHHALVQCTDQNELWGAESTGQPYVDAFMIRIALDRGDVAAARGAFEESRHRQPMGDGARLCGESEAMLLLAEGRVDAAAARLDDIRDLMTVVKNPVWRPVRSLDARVHAARGDLDGAIELVEAELRLARAWGTPELVGRTLTQLARYLGPIGVQPVREAIDLLEGTKAALELARAQGTLGDLLLDRPAWSKGDEKEAIDSYERALRLAHSCGADGLAADLTAKLDALGVVVAPPTDAGTVLTTSERRIAAMAAEGRSEREIAQALFMTPPTVRNGIADIYTRLGIRTPDELRAALAAG